MTLEVSLARTWKGFALDISFSSQNELLGVLGASGSGKSLTLKCIAGVEMPEKGRITAGGRVLFDSAQKISLKPQARRVGYLFQHYALFPHMTVEENIGCALGSLTKGQRQKKVAWLLERFQLEKLGRSYPGRISGGQQQRVALARILAYEPEVLLLDEPFSALDFHLKEQMQIELLDFLRDYPGDVVLVTHNRDEAYRFCRRLVILENGQCIAQGDTRALFRDPGLLSVASLTGCKNFSRFERRGPCTVFALDWNVELTAAVPIPQDVDYIGVREHHFSPASGNEKTNCFPITVRSIIEGPFEWNVLFHAQSAGGGGEPRDICWTVAKEKYDGAAPPYLQVLPENILLLRSTGRGELRSAGRGEQA
jgi:molybdate transport system ATP-binding protein